jgi:hypothetical protein
MREREICDEGGPTTEPRSQAPLRRSAWPARRGSPRLGAPVLVFVQSSDAINVDAGRRSRRKAGTAVTSGRLRLPAQAFQGIGRVAEL